MDLRIIKTKKAIREAFLELRKTLPLEKIKVTDVCRIALINKTTFYKYYQDIFALSEELEKEAMETFWDGFNARDCLLSDPYHFTSEFPKAMNEHGKMLQLLYRDRFEMMAHSIDDRFVEYYVGEERNVLTETFMTFIVGGAMQTMGKMKMESRYDDEDLKKSISSLIVEFVKTYNIMRQSQDNSFEQTENPKI